MNKKGQQNRMQRNRRPQQGAHQLAGNTHIRKIERDEQVIDLPRRLGSRSMRAEQTRLMWVLAEMVTFAVATMSMTLAA